MEQKPKREKPKPYREPVPVGIILILFGVATAFFVISHPPKSLADWLQHLLSASVFALVYVAWVQRHQGEEARAGPVVAGCGAIVVWIILMLVFPVMKHYILFIQTIVERGS
jgi:hypothetical protein